MKSSKANQRATQFLQKLDELFSAYASLLMIQSTDVNKKKFGSLIDILYMYSCNEIETAKPIRAKYWLNHRGSTTPQKWMYSTTLNYSDEQKILTLANQVVSFFKSEVYNYRLLSDYPPGCRVKENAVPINQIFFRNTLNPALL